MVQRPKRNRLALLGPYIVAFIVPVLVMIIICLQRGIYPFGTKCFLRTDLYHQYAPFFKELNYKLTHGGSLFYSWNIGGGTNFWALSAYYLASPLNILVALCPEEYIIEYVTATIFFKIALCSVGMTYYLNKKHDKSGAEGYGAVIFGIFYALSGYMAAYNWNVMWLDCIALFPIVILGVERLAFENKGLLYGFALGLSIFTNYYIAIMTCAGVLLYCIFLVAVDKRFYPKFGIKFLKFIAYTALAVLLSAVFLFPYIRYFGMTASATNSFKWEWTTYFSVFKMIARHLINVEVHTGLDHWPNIYSGMAVFLLIPFYYLNKKISLREKIGYTVFIIFFYFSFSTRAMDYIWHVLHIPNSLPCRQAFIYIFLLLTMCYRGFIGTEDRTYRDITFSMIAALLFIFAVQEINPDTKIYGPLVIFISAVFVILYAILLYLKRRGRIYRDILIVLFIAVAAMDVCVDTTVTSVPTVTRSDYTSFDDGVAHAMDIIHEKEGENTFYRVEKVQLRTKNDGAWLHYPSISTFSSCANARLSDFYKLLGMESSTNAYGSFGQTEFSNMLLGVKYSIAQKAWPDNPDLYRLVSSNGSNVWVYENLHTLSLGTVFSTDVFEEWLPDSYAPMNSINDLAFRVSGIQDLYENVYPSYTPGSYVSITVDEPGYYYAYSPRTGPREIRVRRNGYDRKFTYLNRGFLMQLYYLNAGETVTFENVESGSAKSISISLYRLNEEKFDEVYKAFNKTPLIVDSIEDTRVLGHVTVPSGGGILFTSIANEEGWTVYVDGKQVEKKVAKNAYIEVELSAGAHEIEFRYEVPLFKISLLLTIGSAFIMLLIFVISRIKKRKAEKEEAALEGEELDIPMLDRPAEEAPATTEPAETVQSEALKLEEAAPAVPEEPVSDALSPDESVSEAAPEIPQQTEQPL